MININTFYDFLCEHKIEISFDQLQEIFNKIDIKKEFEKEKQRFTIELWDKESSINGIGAKDIIKSRPYKIDNAFLVYIDGRLVYFQDHNPYVNGYKEIKENEIYDIAFKFTKERIEEETEKAILKKILLMIYIKQGKE